MGSDSSVSFPMMTAIGEHRYMFATLEFTLPMAI